MHLELNALHDDTSTVVLVMLIWGRAMVCIALRGRVMYSFFWKSGYRARTTTGHRSDFCRQSRLRYPYVVLLAVLLRKKMNSF